MTKTVEKEGQEEAKSPILTTLGSPWPQSFQRAVSKGESLQTQLGVMRAREGQETQSKHRVETAGVQGPLCCPPLT